MKKLLFILSLGIITTFAANAQISGTTRPVPRKPKANQPPSVEFVASKTGPGEGTLTFNISMGKGWRVYAVKQDKGVPLKTSIVLDESDSYALNGPVEEPGALTRMDKNLKAKVRYFENSVTFVQKIKLIKSKRKDLPRGLITIRYMYGKDGQKDATAKKETVFIII